MSSTLNVIRIICRFVDNNTHKYLDHDVVYSILPSTKKCTIITSSCVKLSNCKVISTIDDQGLNSDPMIIRLYSQLGKGCKNDFLQNQGA